MHERKRSAPFTFTLTFICHPGKTHNHRSRGDTPWRAQKVPPRALTRFSNFLWQGVVSERWGFL